MKIKFLLGSLVLQVISVLILSACSPTPPPKDKIRIGRAVSLTGPNAIIAKSASIPVYNLWVEEVNEKGGIYVKEYKKRLPVEMIVYDDESDYEKTVLLLQKLIVEEKVDFVLPPCSTLYLFAAAPVANKLGYIMMGAEGGALKIEEYAAALPYFFPVLNYADTQMKALAEVYIKNGIKSVAIVFIEDLHGTEWSGAAIKEFEKWGIKVKTARSIPLGAKDISSFLKRAKGLDVDAFMGFTYPNESILAVKQAIELGINFKVFHVNVGPCFGWFPGLFGKAVEGVMGGGAWNCKSSPGAEEFCQKFISRYGEAAADWWGHLMYYASLQFFEQAIEEAGTLNQEEIRDVMAKERFQTVLGETWFEGGRLAPACHPGEIGQWQNGVFEVIARKEKATAEPMIPKPTWPAPAPKKNQQAAKGAN